MHQIVMDTTEVEEFNNLEHIPIKQSVRHPFYNDRTTDYDFWVIELEWSTQKYKDHVVKLDTPTDGLDLDDGSPYRLIGMGFGTLFAGGYTPNLMQEVTLDYIPNDSCGDYPPGAITDTMLCAGSLRQDSCQVRRIYETSWILSRSSLFAVTNPLRSPLGNSHRVTRVVPSLIQFPRHR